MSNVTVMVTNGGPHPPDKWAAATAEKIVDLVQIDELSNSEIAATARKEKPRFAIALTDALEPVFRSATNDESDRVTNGIIKKRNDPFDYDYASAALSEVEGAAKGTMFADHFSSPDVTQIVQQILTQFILDALNIQRSWAFDAKGL